jgi:hypothetical protein
VRTLASASRDVVDVVDVALEPPAALRVRVVPQSRGTRIGHPVRVRSLDGDEVDLLGSTDASGGIEVRRLHAGRYSVAALDPREDALRKDARARVREVALRAGETLDVEIPVPDVTEVEGRVFLAGLAPETARVGLGPLKGTPDWFRPLLFDVVDGRFRGRMPPGEYHASVTTPSGRVDLPLPFVVPAAPSHRMEIRVGR